MIEVYDRGGEAPLRLFLGSDAVSLAEAKQAQVQRAIAEQRAISISTDF
ncbi:MAG TPA: hypothetical protein VHM25_00350 [Polyangiaceae bacterium]|nr:hypothetical protein [Polyangiaceae bacterium]